MPAKSRHKKSFFRRLLNKIILLFFVILATFIAVISGIIYKEAQELPDISDLNTVATAQTSKIYSADGVLLANLFSENRTMIPLSDVSQNMIDAVIATEDERFFSHPGVDVTGIVRALVRDIKAGQIEQGGSTITQQYVKNAYFSNERTVSRKVKEAILSYKLERKSTKEEILENYLNTVYFGHGAYGVETAAETFFDKKARDLSVSDSALLASLISSPAKKSPYKYPEKAPGHRSRTLKKMQKMGFIDKDEFQTSSDEPIQLKPLGPRHYQKAPYFVEYVRRNLEKTYGEEQILRGGLKVVTTIDSKLQQYAEQAVSQYFKGASDPSVGIVAIDPNSGAVRAMVGGKNFASNQFNLAAQGKRQPGSAFKPFVLAAAVSMGISPDRAFDGSSPLKIPLDEGGFWEVSNFEGANKGDISLRDATAYSVNTVFAQLIMETGTEKVVGLTKNMGISDTVSNNPAIALGGLKKGVSPMDMAVAYSAFANGGFKYDPFSVIRITDVYNRILDETQITRQQVLDETTAYLVTDVLKDVIKKGTGTRADIGREAAGKTGTTQDNGDAWFIGYTPDLVACVWTGFPEENKPMQPLNGKKMTGGYIPALIWKDFMENALSDKKESTFKEIDDLNIVRLEMCGESDMQKYKATEACPTKVSQIHIKGLEPSAFCPEHRPNAKSSGGDNPDLRISVPEIDPMTSSISSTSQSTSPTN